MLRVTLDVNGRSIGTLRIVNRGPILDAAGQPTDTSPGGERAYDVALIDSDDEILGQATITHARRDGAWTLVGAAIAALEDAGALPRFADRHGADQVNFGLMLAAAAEQAAGAKADGGWV